MLALEDLIVANLVAAEELYDVEFLRRILRLLDAKLGRAPLLQHLHHQLGLHPDRTSMLHQRTQLILRQRREDALVSVVREAGLVGTQTLTALVREQVAVSYAWTLTERLKRDELCSAEQCADLQQKVSAHLDGEEVRLLKESRSARFQNLLAADALGEAFAEGAAEDDGTTAVCDPALLPTPESEKRFATVVVGDSGERSAFPRSPAVDAQGAPVSAEETKTQTVRHFPEQLEEDELARDIRGKIRALRASRSEGAPAALLEEGTLVEERYRVAEELGRGAMGVVYAVIDEESGQRLALKVILGGASAEARARFRREILVSERIQNPHVIRVLGHGHLLDGAEYLVMEYLEGESLSAILRREGPLPFDRALELLSQLLEGVQSVHRRRIVHRDLKPSNLQVVERDGYEHVKIVDFGISRFLDDASPDDQLVFVTMAGVISGTPQYVAPEAILEPGDPRRSHDIYSCGVVAFRMLTGDLPFSRVLSVPEQLQCTLYERPRPLDEVCPERAPHPRPLQDLMNALLEADPRARPKTAADALVLVEQVRSQLSR